MDPQPPSDALSCKVSQTRVVDITVPSQAETPHGLLGLTGVSLDLERWGHQGWWQKS